MADFLPAEAEDPATETAFSGAGGSVTDFGLDDSEGFAADFTPADAEGSTTDGAFVEDSLDFVAECVVSPSVMLLAFT